MNSLAVDHTLQRQAPATRDLRVDFFRGLALIFIFWDHIPDSPFGLITLRNLGFSDAAELFVFLSGYGAALAYARVYGNSGYFAAALRVLRRAWVLYVVHVFLLAQLMAVIFVTNAQVEARDFVQEMGLNYFVQNPQRALVEGLLLRFKPGLMDPLPLYIVLLLAMAAVLPLLIARPLTLLLGSGLLYWMATRTGLNLRGKPDGVWFFNPLAWQFLFCLGAVAATHRERVIAAWRAVPASLRRHCFAALSIVLLVSLLIVVSWNFPAWHDRLMPQQLAELLYPIDKTNLAPIRLLHFLALACWINAVLPTGRWLQQPAPSAVRSLGRHSLEIFCLGVLLAPLVDGVNTLGGDGWWVRCLTSLLACAVLFALSAWLDWIRRCDPGRPPHTILPVSTSSVERVE